MAWQAIKLLDASLVIYDPALIRGRARLLAQKAEAYYRLGAIEACTASANETLTPWPFSRFKQNNSTYQNALRSPSTIITEKGTKRYSIRGDACTCINEKNE